MIVTDQQRGDCLSLDGHPVLQTPHIDEIGGSGAFFRHAYSACPLCIPARRTLMTGTRACTHGLVGNQRIDTDLPTLPNSLRDAGYQTHLVGKLHFWPERKRYGFDSMDWSDGPYEGSALGDYGTFLYSQVGRLPRASLAHGATLNSPIARPWHLEDRLHFTNWVTDRSIEFLEHRDPTTPYFLKVSYFHPHVPCTPPEFYYNRYINMDLPQPVIGDWARVSDQPVPGNPVRGRRFLGSRAMSDQFRAGYFGCINHIDDQVGRILDMVKGDENTIIVFVSDHGEMLGDHQYFQKSQFCEAAARIPFLVRLPESMGIAPNQTHDALVELMDVMPTLLDAAGVEIPDTVEGRSLVPLLRGETENVRDFVHLENVNSGHKGHPEAVSQALTDGRWKYVWRPMLDDELLFDLDSDPNELLDLADRADQAERLAIWRSRLIQELDGRQEGFTDGKQLIRQTNLPPLIVPGSHAEKFV
jgi:arylsulfatase